MKEQSLVIAGSNGEDIQMKYLIPDQVLYTSPILILHGFKGFMDWGHFPYVANKMVERGHFVVMVNYSHNGTSSEAPTDFVRLDLFSKNTYSKELFDVGKVLDELEQSELLKEHKVDGSQVNLIGHSRGGGMAIIIASEDPRVRKLVTWAAINSAGSFWGRDERLIREWKEAGVFYIPNARTNQEMPLRYSLYEDSIVHAERLDIKAAAKNVNVPWLIIHGDEDPTIPVKVAESLHEIQPKSQLYIMEQANHNFGGKHPLDETANFGQIDLLFQTTINFLEPNIV